MVRRKKTTFILIVFVILFVVLLVRYVPILWGIFIDKRIDLTTTSEYAGGPVLGTAIGLYASPNVSMR